MIVIVWNYIFELMLLFFYLFGFGEVKVFFKWLMVLIIDREILGICSELFVINFEKIVCIFF